MNSRERHEARYRRRRAKREAKRAEANASRSFEQVFTYSHLYRSYRMCCLGVGWKKSTQTYRANAIYNVARTWRELMAGKFRSKGFYEFDLFERGKPRHIRAVHISERVVQRCLCDYALVPLLERSFIYDNGASMKGKGIDFSLNRLEAHLHRYWREHGGSDRGYVLTFDVHHFFDSIPHDHVKRIIDKAVSDERIKAMTNYFIDQFGGAGMGLGSQVSQICALASLNGLDHFIKERLGIRYYGRYMDDGYLIHDSKEHLRECKQRILAYCHSIGFELNPDKTQIRPLSRGLRFLKIRFFLTDTGRVVRLPPRKNISGMRRKLKKFRAWLTDPRRNFGTEDARTSFVSWQGHIQHCDSWRTNARMEQLYRTLFPEMEVTS